MRYCPKCESTNIYTNVGARLINRSVLSIDTWTTPAPLGVYMCMGCGYLEYYVVRPEDREKVARKWVRPN